MAAYITMPKLSDTMTEGTVVNWLVNEGESIEAGDILAEIETDKATMEMECFDDGIVYRHLVGPGSKAPIGTVIAVIIEEDEEPPTDAEIAAGGAGGEEQAKDEMGVRCRRGATTGGEKKEEEEGVGGRDPREKSRPG